MGSNHSGGTKTPDQDRLKRENQLLKKQIARQERMTATQIVSIYGLATVGMLVGFLKTKKPVVLVPVVPLTFLASFHLEGRLEVEFGNKIHDKDERSNGEGDTRKAASKIK